MILRVVFNWALIAVMSAACQGPPRSRAGTEADAAGADAAADGALDRDGGPGADAPADDDAGPGDDTAPRALTCSFDRDGTSLSTYADDTLAVAPVPLPGLVLALRRGGELRRVDLTHAAADQVVTLGGDAVTPTLLAPRVGGFLALAIDVASQAAVAWTVGALDFAVAGPVRHALPGGSPPTGGAAAVGTAQGYGVWLPVARGSARDVLMLALAPDGRRFGGPVLYASDARVGAPGGPPSGPAITTLADPPPAGAALTFSPLSADGTRADEIRLDVAPPRAVQPGAVVGWGADGFLAAWPAADGTVRVQIATPAAGVADWAGLGLRGAALQAAAADGRVALLTSTGAGDPCGLRVLGAGTDSGPLTPPDGLRDCSVFASLHAFILYGRPSGAGAAREVWVLSCFL